MIEKRTLERLFMKKEKKKYYKVCIKFAAMIFVYRYNFMTDIRTIIYNMNKTSSIFLNKINLLHTLQSDFLMEQARLYRTVFQWEPYSSYGS